MGHRRTEINGSEMFVVGPVDDMEDMKSDTEQLLETCSEDEIEQILELNS